MRRPTYVSTSIVASSAQCASSTMQIVAPEPPRSSSTSRAASTPPCPSSTAGAAPAHVEERAERARHREVIARAGQHARRAPFPGHEGPHQARLADARLAADQGNPAVARHDRSERRLERGQRILPLE